MKKIIYLLSIIPSLRLKKEYRRPFLLIAVILISLIEPFMFPTKADASIVLQAYYVPDRMTAATLPTGSVCVKPSGAVTESSATITFPSSYTIDTTLANWTLNSTATNIPPGTTQWPTTTSGNATAANNGTKAVTWTVGDITSTSTINCFHFVAAGTSVSGSAANDLQGSIATNADSTARGIAISLVSSGSDQVVVTATVQPTFSFALSVNTAALGTLNVTGGGAAKTAAVTETISTNAPNGWTSWAKNAGANSTLTSATTSDTSISSGAFASGAGNVHTISTAAAGYGLSAAAGSGAPTIATEYAGNGTSTFGSLDSTQFEKIASQTTTANANTVTLTFGAEATPTTKPATDYTDTVTITAAGTF